jgi:phosphoribosylanthranilate isomerase
MMQRPIPSAKICGLSTEQHAQLAASLGAGLIGFVHFPKSPRHILPAHVAPSADSLRAQYPMVGLVAVTVNADDLAISDIMHAYDPDYLQLHGDESPLRCAELQELYQVGIIKAIPVATVDDLKQAEEFDGIADMILFDAKPTVDETLPGGNGRAFDWQMLATHAELLPHASSWLLSGGLTVENVAEAARLTNAEWVDVSSGVEYQPGQKDPARIRAFFDALQSTPSK